MRSAVGQPAEPLRPAAPAPVLTAVKLMYVGAVGAAVQLIVWLAIAVGDVKAAARWRWLGHGPTAAQLSQLKPLIVTALAVVGLVVIALWLWMARANGRGRNWARILSTVLFGLATLELSGNHDAALASLAALTWLTGLAAVWQLWRPAAGAFFNPPARA
jgi:hypothetical protein